MKAIKSLTEEERKKNAERVNKIAALKEKLDVQRRERYNKDLLDKEQRKQPFMTEFPFSKNKVKGLYNRFEPISPEGERQETLEDEKQQQQE